MKTTINRITERGSVFMLSVFLFGTYIGCAPENKLQEKTNIVLILVDDLGYGDVGCYGSVSNLTPNIDRMAAEGMRFTDFHSNGPMCTPTRAALLTGNYQQRYGEQFEGPLSGKTQYNEGLPLGAETMAEMLKKAGYATGMFGKWHLGYKEPFLPTNQGFDEFIGLAAGDGDHHSHIDRWGREDWWKNNRILMEEGYSTRLLTDHAVSFIERHRDEPFFLYVPYPAIHFPWQGPEDPSQREKGNSYENDKWGIIENKDNVRPHVKAMVEDVDESVGMIIKKLSELHIDERTLVIFTSDNGGYIHYDHQFKNISDNGPFRGQKAELYEGGHRVPFIARWPGKIFPKTESDEIALTMDLYPTFANIAGLDQSSHHGKDGVDMSSLLFENKALPDRTLFWRMEDEIAVRNGPWKLVKIGNKPLELYNLDEDIGETNNVAESNVQIADRLWTAYETWDKEVTDTRN